MAYIDYKKHARTYRFEGRALTETEITRLLWDVETFSVSELLATFEKFGLSCLTRASKSQLCEALGECLRIAPTFGGDGKIIAPRLVYDAKTKTLTVSKLPTICDLKKLNRARKEQRNAAASSESKPRREPPRDWEEYRRRNNRRKAASNASET